MTVTVGFLGAGLIADFHALMLSRSHADYRAGPVYDPEDARAADFSERWGAVVAGSEDEVLDTADAVYVCTWTSEHPRLVLAAADRGRPVFCEKPLATGSAAARAMTEAVESAGVVNQVGLVLRYSPAFNLARHLVADPGAGRVMTMVFRDDQYLPVQGTYRSGWRGDRSKAGAGTLLEHSIHDLDLLEYTIGPVEQVSACSANHHGLDGIEDAVAAVVRFVGGGLGTLVSVWHDVLERGSQRHVEIFCEKLYVEVSADWQGPVTWQFTGEDSCSLAGADLLAENKRRRVHRGNPDSAFIRAVETATPASPSFRDALRAHLLADACYSSAAQGGAPVAVPPA
jgi:predicted dehydrogenase